MTDPSRGPAPAPARIAALVAGTIALAAYVLSDDPHAVPHDWGEFQTLAATGGIAHAGYPTLVLLLRLFGALPFGTLAFRANLLACLCGAFAVAALAWFVARRTGRVAPALIAALGFGFAHVMWKESVHAGVHGFTLALDVALFLLALCFAQRPGAETAAAIGLLLGLGLTSHLTVLGVTPVLIWALVRARRAGGLRAAQMAAAAAGLVVGLSMFGVMLAQDRPTQPMNYIEDVLSLEPGQYFVRADEIPRTRIARAAWLVSGRQYFALAESTPVHDVPRRLRFLAVTLALNDLPWLGLPLVLLGAIALARRRRSAADAAPDGALPLALWLLGALAMMAAGATYPMVPIFFLPGLWVLGVALGEALDVVAAWSRPGFALVAALVLAAPLVRLIHPVAPAFLTRFQDTREAFDEFPVAWSPFHRDPGWERYGHALLDRLPPHATVLALWGECTLLRELTLGLHVRPDVTVLPVGSGARVGHALERAAARGSPAFATYAPAAADLAGARLVAVATWPRGTLYRIAPGGAAAR